MSQDSEAAGESQRASLAGKIPAQLARPANARSRLLRLAQGALTRCGVLSFAAMFDPRLPLKIAPVPGGFVVAFARGGQHIHVYGREAHVAQAAGTLTIDEAEARAQDISRVLTAAWDGGPD